MKVTYVLLPPSIGPLGSGQFLLPDVEGVHVEVKLLYEQGELVDQQLVCTCKVP